MPTEYEYENRSGTNRVVEYSKDEREENGIHTEHVTIHENEKTDGDKVAHWHYDDGSDKVVIYDGSGIKSVSYREAKD